MAYASAVAVTVQEILRAGLDISTLPVTPTATHGNKIPNDGRTFVLIKNGSASPITATIETPGSVDGMALADLTVTINAGVTMAIGPFTSNFNQSDGYVWVVLSAVTSVTMGAYRLKA